MEKIKFATRSQLQHICDLGGDRNANRILQRLEEEKLIKSFRWQQKIYSIAKAGRQLIGSDVVPIKRIGYVEHRLMCNEAYITLGMPEDWITEQPANFKHKGIKKRFVPDAKYKKDGRLVFVEVDRTQRMNENRTKIETYADLQSEYKRKNQRPPKIIFYTVSNIRKQKLKQLAKEINVEADVYIFEDLN